MFFWLAAILLSAFTLLAILRPLLRKPIDTAAPANGQVHVYKHQLGEIDSDLARGVLSPLEANAMRVEVSRRLLSAGDLADATRPYDIAPGARFAVIAVSGILSILAIALYLQLGSPHLSGQPLQQRLANLAQARALRPNQDEAERVFAAAVLADPTLGQSDPNPADLDLIAQLRAALTTRPGDLRGHELLARTQAQVGLWADASQTQQGILDIKSQSATGADFLALGEYMVLAAGGYVSPEAEQAFAAGLTLDPTNPLGRYYSGLALAQGGRPDLAYRLWTGLLAQGPADAPWLPAVNAALPEVAAAAGLPMPEILSGPDAAAIAEAAEMNESDRGAMIAAMVEALATRLNAEGGTAAEWAQLIRAYGVLGQTASAARAWDKAKQTFAQDEPSLTLLHHAAQTAEIAN